MRSMEQHSIVYQYVRKLMQKWITSSVQFSSVQTFERGWVRPGRSSTDFRSFVAVGKEGQPNAKKLVPRK